MEGRKANWKEGKHIGRKGILKGRKEGMLGGKEYWKEGKDSIGKDTMISSRSDREGQDERRTDRGSFVRIRACSRKEGRKEGREGGEGEGRKGRYSNGREGRGGRKGKEGKGGKEGDIPA